MAPGWKVWCPEFSKSRKLNEQTLSELKTKLNADEEHLGNYFLMYGNEDSPLEVEVLEDFCQDTSLEDVKAGKGRAGTQRVVWVDERVGSPDLKGSGVAKQHENPLTATGLFRALKPQFGDHTLPDAVRKLIYITDLDPGCIQALAATASYHQSLVLRNAIFQCLNFQTSIAVKISSVGFLTFQLDLHLPFFILSKSTPPEKPEAKSNIKLRRSWTDLSFLRLDKPGLRPQEPTEVWGIQEAQISCVVAGSDHWRWVGYGFIDSEIDGILAESSDCDLLQDQIAAGDIEARFPVWTPRDYWIKVFEIRIGYVGNQWYYLIYNLELGINNYISEHHPSTLSHSSRNAREQAAKMKESFDWALETLSLLRRLDSVLSNTLTAWKSFNSPGGDLEYFSDITLSARRSLCAIQKIFQKVEEKQNTLLLLKENCSDFSRALELHSHLEVKEIAAENGVISEFTVTILYPVALAAALFSMQPAAIPFDLNPRAFALSVVIIIATVYTIRLIDRHIQRCWPLLKNSIALWLKRSKGGESIGVSGDRFRDTFPPHAGIDLDTIVDEERGDASANDTRACGTRAIRGLPATGPPLQPD